MDDPRYLDVIREGVLTRRVAGNVHLIAGAGGNEARTHLASSR